MGDPLNEQTETMAALRQVFDAAGPYLDSVPTGWCTTGRRSRCWPSWAGRCRRTGSGTRGRGRDAAADRHGDRDRLGRPALLPLRHRRLDPGRAGRRLDRVAAGPERVRAGLVALRRRGRDSRAALAARAVRPAGRLGRRAGRQRHLRQLHRAGLRHALVGRAARRRRGRRRAGRPAPDAGAVRRLRAPQRPQGAADARPRQGHRRGVRPRRRSAGSTWPRCDGGWPRSTARPP